jgi:multidrug efflux system membrane fusion protein
VEAGPAAPAIRTTGQLANKDEFRLSFKVGGVIKRIGVREGERVKRGQRLAEIEQTEINAQVEQAKQSFEKAQRDVERGERLYADKVISLEQLEDLRTQRAVAEAALSAAQFNWYYAAIIAPSDGIVLRKLAEERELVAAGTPVLVLSAEEGGYVVKAGVADREIVQIRLGDVAEIRLDALPGEVLRGKVTEVASAADPQSGMFGVEVTLDATDLPLKSGLVAKLSLTPASAQAGLHPYVPIASIVEGSGRKASVYVLDGERVRRREITVAFIADERVALASGVSVGEQVVTDGALYLEDGELVTASASAPNAAAP